MLNRLLEHARREGLRSEPGFARKTVRWAVCCDPQTRFTGVVPLGDDRPGLSFDQCPHLAQNEMIAGGETRSQFLIESLQTLALYSKENASADEKEKSQQKQAYFVRLLNEASAVAPWLAAAAVMLQDKTHLASIRSKLERQKAKPTDTATIMVGDINPLERDEWHAWWRTFRAGLSKGARANPENTTRMRCLLSGELIVPAGTHPKVKGLAGVGGLGMGDVLAGFDKEAFQSFGLEQSANAAMSEDIATAYVETLNRLIKDHSVKLANTVAVYWYKTSVRQENDPLAFLYVPSGTEEAPDENPPVGAETQVRKLLEALRTGERPDLLDNEYYAFLLSGAAGRVMVRDWLEGTFKDLAAHVEEWFVQTSITAIGGKRLARERGLESIVTAVLPRRKPSQKYGDWVTPIGNLTRELWRCALTGKRFPYALIARFVLVLRPYWIELEETSAREQPMLLSLLYRRVALIKAYHQRNLGDAAMQPYLNPEHTDPAYHCGRLLAVLARLQRAALGDVGAGVVQRYYSAASQTPALVIGRLISNAKNHLGKLKGGRPYWFEQQIAEIMGRIGDMPPRTLDLERQSLFALGYYQQLAKLNARETKDSIEDNESNPDE